MSGKPEGAFGRELQKIGQLVLFYLRVAAIAGVVCLMAVLVYVGPFWGGAIAAFVCAAYLGLQEGVYWSRYRQPRHGKQHQSHHTSA